ncbi:YqeG family HAD IIIA-type phosphatase [Filibacter tadaridae]|uniref:UMP phosphatase n=1 Tax=Filibacter tadaridae TaxID=2483811 RepID=A0A3P5XTV7_9BACL|nr:YqeG family HAD IIIA-type phosphatase [Filibacter tadaridae]VDC32555.1 UMP phosphatase [Filibacter tadaridae]
MFNYFLPNEFVKTVFQVTPEYLRAKGIKGVITDLDNTLVAWDNPAATPEIIEWMKGMNNAGILVTVVSNNNEMRVKTFCDPLGTPFICDARKPMTKSFKKACAAMGTKKEETVVIGDQLMTDILGGNRKGLHTILVVPVASSDGFFTKFNRMIERRIMARMKRRGLITWED